MIVGPILCLFFRVKLGTSGYSAGDSKKKEPRKKYTKKPDGDDDHLAFPHTPKTKLAKKLISAEAYFQSCSAYCKLIVSVEDSDLNPGPFG